ncbi:hypothetical protein WCN91_04925 [Pseudoalteromonas sp. YIC-827]|uniref:Bacteriophage N4 adsorption protein A C-terminal domain-containing protein n=1 Tax=Pseudoalteromonas qingdaonensis TaxID=3131913 RepID=A0ABU9MTZ0_9GAMM
MRMICLALLASWSVAAAKPGFEAGKNYSEYTQFLLYPHVDMAYRHIDKQQYAEAEDELHKALAITADNPYLLERLFYVVSAQQDWLELARLYGHHSSTLLAQPQWHDTLVHYVQLGLAQQPERFIGFVEPLLGDTRLSLTQRSQLGALSASVVNTEMRAAYIERLVKTYNLNELQLNYCFALLESDAFDSVATCITEVSDPEQQLQIRKHFIQALIGAQRYQEAGDQFLLYQQQTQLSADERAQWLELSMMGQDWHQALALNAAMPASVAQLLQRADIAKLAQNDEELSSTLIALTQMQLHQAQEYRVLVLMADQASKKAPWRQRFYRYQVHHLENHSAWRERAIQIAQAHQDNEFWVTLLAAQPRLSRQQQLQLALGYDRLGQQQQAQQHWQTLAERYPYELAYAARASHFAMQQQQYAQVVRLLAPFWPLASSQDESAELSYRFLSSLEQLDPERVPGALKQAFDVPLSLAQQAIFSGFASTLEYCDLAAHWLAATASLAELHQLGTCYAKLDKERAYTIFKRAEQLAPEDVNTRVQLAYLSSLMGLHQNAFDYWLSLDRELSDAEQLHNAIVSAVNVHQYAPAMTWLHRLEALDIPKEARFYQLQLLLAQRLGDVYTQEQSLLWLNQQQPQPSYQIQLAGLYWQQGKQQQAMALVADIEALGVEHLTVNDLAPLGYLYTDMEMANKATPLYQEYLNSQPDLYPMHQQLAYSYVAINELDAALEHATIAAQHMDIMALDKPAQQQLKRLRRDLLADSRWLLQAQIGEQLLPIDASPQANELDYGGFIDVRYSQRLHYHWREQDTHQWYARAFMQGDEDNRATTLATGYSWQPSAAIDFNLAIEPQWQLDSGHFDVMVKAATDVFSISDSRANWQVEGEGWVQQSLYLEAVHWLKADQGQIYAQYQGGYHFKLSESVQRAFSLQPYVQAQWAHSGQQQDSRIGVGLGLHWWGQGDEITAYRSRAMVKLLLQRVMDGEREGENLVTMNVEWLW